jgi:hypothetical protein
MIDALIAIAITIVGQTEGKAEAIAHAAKAAMTTLRVVGQPVVRPSPKYVGCGAAELAEVEADAEFANKVLLWPDSIDQELVAREMLGAAQSRKRAVLAMCAPSTVMRPGPKLGRKESPYPDDYRKESPYHDDPFDEDRDDRRSADIDLDKTTMRIDGKVVPARELVDAIRAMSGEIEDLRRQLRELKEAKR